MAVIAWGLWFRYRAALPLVVQLTGMAVTLIVMVAGVLVLFYAVV